MTQCSYSANNYVIKNRYHVFGIYKLKQHARTAESAEDFHFSNKTMSSYF